MSWFECYKFSNVWKIWLKLRVIILISLFIALISNDYPWVSVVRWIHLMPFRIFYLGIVPLNGYVGIMLFFNLKFEEKRLSFKHFDSLELITVSKYGIANIYTLETLHEFLEWHCEVSIIYCSAIWSYLRPKLFYKFWIDSIPKFFIILACKTRVFCFAPWIS